MAAEELSISRASERLFVSQPAVSRQIKDLEEELGLELFDRLPNGLRLTEAGESALAHAREILRQSNALTEAMKSMASRDTVKTVKVGFLPTALPGRLTNAMRIFNSEQSQYRVQIHEMSPVRQEQALRDGEIDLALIGVACPELRRDFSVTTLHKTELAMIVADDHRLAKRKSVDLAEFADDTFVTLNEEYFPGRVELMADMFCKAGISAEVSMRASGLSEMLGLIGGGAGVALAPADLAKLPHPGVVFLKLRKPRRTMLFHAAWRKTGDISGVQSLLKLITDAG